MVAGYIVEIKKADQADTEYQKMDAGNVSSYTFIGLDENTNYTMRATAYNAGGDGTTSSAISRQTPIDFGSIEAPTISSSAAETTLNLSWGAITNATSYQVRYKLESATNFGNWATITTTSYQITGLTVQTSYTIQIRSIFLDSSNNQVYGNAGESIISTSAYAPPGPPRNVIQTAFSANIEATGGSMGWSAPNTGGPLSAYDYYIRINGSTESGTTTNTQFVKRDGTALGEISTVADGRVRSKGPGGASDWVAATTS